jgi:hypothetical protein
MPITHIVEASLLHPGNRCNGMGFSGILSTYFKENAGIVSYHLTIHDYPNIQGRIYSCGGPRGDRNVEAPISNLGYENSFLFALNSYNN